MTILWVITVNIWKFTVTTGIICELISCVAKLENFYSKIENFRQKIWTVIFALYNDRYSVNKIKEITIQNFLVRIRNTNHVTDITVFRFQCFFFAGLWSKPPTGNRLIKYSGRSSRQRSFFQREFSLHIQHYTPDYINCLKIRLAFILFILLILKVKKKMTEVFAFIPWCKLFWRTWNFFGTFYTSARV